MKSTSLEAMEAELCIARIDLRLQELQTTEAIKIFPKNDKYISSNIEKKIISNKSHLGHHVKKS